MTVEDLQRLESAVLAIFKATAPTRTGTLKGQIRVVLTEKGFNVISDIYYMPFTEEKWISPRWRGRANPNEGWFKRSMDLSIQFLQNVTGRSFERVS